MVVEAAHSKDGHFEIDDGANNCLSSFFQEVSEIEIT
jgi:hypothetical protein